MNSQPRNPSGRRRPQVQLPIALSLPLYGLQAPGLEDIDIPPGPRQLILSLMMGIQSRDLNRFMADVFANEALAEAYVKPLRATCPGDPTAMPLMQCIEAAAKAAAYPRLMPWERDLVAVAALVYPCGFFWNTWGESTFTCRSDRQPAEDIVTARKCLLEDALRRVRRSDPLLGQTLACLMGLGGDEDLDPDQLNRLRIALSAGLVHRL